MQTSEIIMQLFLQHTTVTMEMGQLEGMADPLPTQLILLISVKIDPVVEGRGNQPFEFRGWKWLICLSVQVSERSPLSETSLVVSCPYLICFPYEVDNFFNHSQREVRIRGEGSL